MKNLKQNLILASLLFPLFLMGHGDKKHEDTKLVQETKKVVESNATKEKLQSINSAYIKDIKPIFKIKCFDCHGTLENSPWYYNVPGIKQLMDWDMEEAKEHLDMRKDFPFVSHETPLEDLKSLKETIEEDEMPPLQYVLGHWDSRLNKKEKKKLYKWVEDSLKELGDTK